MRYMILVVEKRIKTKENPKRFNLSFSVLLVIEKGNFKTENLKRSVESINGNESYKGCAGCY